MITLTMNIVGLCVFMFSCCVAFVYTTCDNKRYVANKTCYQNGVNTNFREQMICLRSRAFCCVNKMYLFGLYRAYHMRVRRFW